ncbi:MAG: T9SS type A sorting domain-containing protein [Aureispira sp.]|nr:T9SS type A sorting domain-containing protein [Aureispira sp.]
MLKLFFTLTSILLTFVASAQYNAACNGARYQGTADFANVDTTFAVLFGSGIPNGSTTVQNLYMDIYEPAGDLATERPLIVLAFGGSFIGGTRQDMSSYCQYYARRGYVVATIDYRLYKGALIPLPSSNTMTDVVIKAVGDMKAAIRFFREDIATSNTYKIDPNFIFAGGISAGAIAASHTAYVDSTDNIEAYVRTIIANNGGHVGNSSTNTQYSSEVTGVINFSGALRDATYIDANDPPLFSVHDDDDQTVPYSAGWAKVFGFNIIEMEGSEAMNDTALVKNVQTELITIPASTGHVSYFNATWQDSVLTSSTRFLHDLMCPAITSTELVEGAETITAVAFPNPSFGDMTIQLSDVPSEYDVAVFDATGRLAHQVTNLSDQEINLSRQQFATGMYFVSIQFHDSKVRPIQEKIIFR